MDSYTYFRVCSDHFLSGKPCTLYDTTNTDWIPSLNFGHSDIRQSDTYRRNMPSTRAAKRRKVQEQVVDKEGDREVLQEESLQVEAVQSTSDEVEPHGKQEDVELWKTFEGWTDLALFFIEPDLFVYYLIVSSFL